MNNFQNKYKLDKTKNKLRKIFSLFCFTRVINKHKGVEAFRWVRRQGWVAWVCGCATIGIVCGVVRHARQGARVAGTGGELTMLKGTWSNIGVQA